MSITKTVVACVLLTAPDGAVQRRVQTFGTMTADLLALADWLDGAGVTQIAMASTGVYWRPIFNVLEGEGRAITLVNPQHIRDLPGAPWAMTRYRKSLVQGRTQEINRVHKLLEGANIKLGAVASDILGKSGRDMLVALAGGEQDPAVRAEWARGRLRAKLPQLRQALDGRLRTVHAVLLTQLLEHIGYLDEAIARLHDAIDATLAPFAEAIALLQTIPGVRAVAAATIVAEIGVDMARFPDAAHLASWAGVCPGNKQSGRARLSGRTTTGSSWLRAVLTEVAWANARSTAGYLGAQFRRLTRRRGVRRALVAVAHSILVSIYHMLRDHRPYADLGAEHFATLDTARLEKHHVKRLNALGFSVTLTPLPTAEPVPA